MPYCAPLKKDDTFVVTSKRYGSVTLKMLTDEIKVSEMRGEGHALVSMDKTEQATLICHDTDWRIEPSMSYAAIEAKRTDSIGYMVLYTSPSTGMMATPVSIEYKGELSAREQIAQDNDRQYARHRLNIFEGSFPNP